MALPSSFQTKYTILIQPGAGTKNRVLIRPAKKPKVPDPSSKPRIDLENAKSPKPQSLYEQDSTRNVHVSRTCINSGRFCTYHRAKLPKAHSATHFNEKANYEALFVKRLPGDSSGSKCPGTPGYLREWSFCRH